MGSVLAMDSAGVKRAEEAITAPARGVERAEVVQREPHHRSRNSKALPLKTIGTFTHGGP